LRGSHCAAPRDDVASLEQSVGFEAQKSHRGRPCIRPPRPGTGQSLCRASGDAVARGLGATLASNIFRRASAPERACGSADGSQSGFPHPGLPARRSCRWPGRPFESARREAVRLGLDPPLRRLQRVAGRQGISKGNVPGGFVSARLRRWNLAGVTRCLPHPDCAQQRRLVRKTLPLRSLPSAIGPVESGRIVGPAQRSRGNAPAISGERRQLTDKELVVLHGALEGRTSKAIARELAMGCPPASADRCARPVSDGDAAPLSGRAAPVFRASRGRIPCGRSMRSCPWRR